MILVIAPNNDEAKPAMSPNNETAVVRQLGIIMVRENKDIKCTAIKPYNGISIASTTLVNIAVKMPNILATENKVF